MPIPKEKSERIILNYILHFPHTVPTVNGLIHLWASVMHLSLFVVANSLLSDIIGQDFFIYLDNLIVVSPDVDIHLQSKHGAQSSP